MNTHMKTHLKRRLSLVERGMSSAQDMLENIKHKKDQASKDDKVMLEKKVARLEKEKEDIKNKLKPKKKEQPKKSGDKKPKER